MKIFYITNVCLKENYGPSIHINNFVNSCRELNIEVNLISNNLKRAFFNKIFFILNTTFLLIFKNRNYDLVYIRYFPFSFILVFVLNLLSKKVVVEYNAVLEYERLHNKKNINFYINKFSSILTAKRCYKIITLSSGIKNYISKKYKIKEKKIFVSSNGSNIKKIQKNRLFFKGLIAYSDVPWYNTQDFIDLKNKLKKIDINLDIYISSPRKNYNNQEIFYDKKIDFSIYDFGLYINDPVKGKYNQIFGVRPIKFFDYLSNGLFVIASDIPDINYIVKNYKIGFVFKKIDEIVYLLNELYKDENMIKEFQQNALKLIENDYNWLKLTKDIVDFIKL